MQTTQRHAVNCDVRCGRKPTLLGILYVARPRVLILILALLAYTKSVAPGFIVFKDHVIRNSVTSA